MIAKGTSVQLVHWIDTVRTCGRIVRIDERQGVGCRKEVFGVDGCAPSRWDDDAETQREPLPESDAEVKTTH